jgi:hypothetical protein
VVGLYEKNGKILSRFSQEAFDKHDLKAKRFLAEFFSCHNVGVWEADKTTDGSVDYSRCDLKIKLQGQVIHIEVEVKLDGWQWIRYGPHVSARKMKQIARYGDRGFLIMLNKDYTEFLVIRFSDLKKALDSNLILSLRDCKNKFAICRKSTNRGGMEDFLAVPYSVVNHVILPKNDYANAKVLKWRSE